MKNDLKDICLMRNYMPKYKQTCKVSGWPIDCVISSGNVYSYLYDLGMRNNKIGLVFLFQEDA